MLNTTDIIPMPFIPSSDTALDHEDHIMQHTLHLAHEEPTYTTTFSPTLPAGAYAPPTSHHVKQIRINTINTGQLVPEPPFIPHSDVPTTIRAQIDTGADLTCTNLIEILHDYRC